MSNVVALNSPTDPTTANPDVAALRAMKYKHTASGATVLVKDVTQIATILHFDNRWRGVLRFNEFNQTICFTHRPQWHELDKPSVYHDTWQDDDTGRMRNFIVRHYDLEFSEKDIYQQVRLHAQTHTINPVADYFCNLYWDQEDRLSHAAATYLGAADNELNNELLRRWMIGAVYRALKPGEKFDTMLILEGPQGAKKSTFFKILARERQYFNDQLRDLKSKDCSQELQYCHIIEIAELDAFDRASVANLKAFLSRDRELLRLPYGHIPVWLSRHCVFGGTVNDSQYLRDATGARRFWPIKVGKIDLEAVERDLDQLWAQATHEYLNDKRCWFEPGQDDKFIAALEEETDSRYLASAAEESLAEWLDSPIYKTVQLDGLDENGWPLEKKELVSDCHGWTSVSEILTKFYRLPKDKWTQTMQNDIAKMLQHLGWKRSRSRDGEKRVYRYVRGFTKGGSGT